tara:strand:+ start:418 stop:552 length:135 start_codon:yes stop_codon:yes gene_type:complete
MPKVGGKKYPYTKEGKAAAAKAKAKMKKKTSKKTNKKSKSSKFQ